MKRHSALLPIPVDGELRRSIRTAATRAKLSQADVMRTALRLGLPELANRLAVRKRPRRPLVEYLDAFAGLTGRNREMTGEPRIK
jgi:hypothetical protein